MAHAPLVREVDEQLEHVWYLGHHLCQVEKHTAQHICDCTQFSWEPRVNGASTLNINNDSFVVYSLAVRIFERRTHVLLMFVLYETISTRLPRFRVLNDSNLFDMNQTNSKIIRNRANRSVGFKLALERFLGSIVVLTHKLNPISSTSPSNSPIDQQTEFYKHHRWQLDFLSVSLQAMRILSNESAEQAASRTLFGVCLNAQFVLCLSFFALQNSHVEPNDVRRKLPHAPSSAPSSLLQAALVCLSDAQTPRDMLQCPSMACGTS